MIAKWKFGATLGEIPAWPWMAKADERASHIKRCCKKETTLGMNAAVGQDCRSSLTPSEVSNNVTPNVV